jgi:acyl-CoA thioester hydrolase
MSDVRINTGVMENGRHYYPARVFYNHTDAGGIVYYANYLRIAEEARVAMFDAVRGGRGGNPLEDGDFVVRSAHVEYFKPARFGDDLVIESRVYEVGKAYLMVGQRVMRGGELLVEISTKLVYVNFGVSGRPQRVPEFWREKFKQHERKENEEQE